MGDEFFGEDKPEHEPHIKVVWPCHLSNQIEVALHGLLYEAISREAHRVPMIFIEGESYNAAEYTAIYGAELTLREAITMGDIVLGDIGERFRRQMIVARESDGTMSDYLLRCEAEGIEPILKGNTP